MKYGIQQAYINQINAVLAIYPAVEEVLLYGSRAKGTHEKWSDIDLAFFGETMTIEHINRVGVVFYERVTNPTQQLQ